MREKIKQKPIVAVLLPIFFLLVVGISVYQWNPLKADDQNTHLVDVKINGEKIDDGFSVTEPASVLEMSAEKAQVLKFVESDKYQVNHLLDEEGQILLIKERSSKELTHYLDLVDAAQKSTKDTEATDQTTASSEESTNQTSTSQEVEEIESQLFYVVEEGKKVPYLLMNKEETIWLSIFNKKVTEATKVVLEIPNTNKKQSLISFSPIKSETTETSKKEEKVPTSSENKEGNDSSEKKKQAETTEKSSSSNVEKETTSSSKAKVTSKKAGSTTKTAKLTKDEKKRNQAIEQLLKEDYTEKDSFKPIELLAAAASSRETKDASSPISVTGAKMTIKDGIENFDGTNDNPGYDSGFSNGLVRSFDSVLYLLTFSLEANDPTTTYSDIKYRVDMELPDAFALDDSGKQRFNAEIVDSEHGEFVDTSATTKTSKGYVESTIKANGQILLPMFVNVYGAQHGTLIKPTMKITIISAKNDKTGKTEDINLVYDNPSEMSALDLKETKVSAKPSVKPVLTKGNRKSLKDFSPDLTASEWDNWDAMGLGVTLSLEPIAGRGKADFKGSTFPSGEIKVEIGSGSVYTAPNGDEKTLTVAETGGDTSPVYAMTSSVAKNDVTGWNQLMHSGKTLNITEDILPLNIPKGKSDQIYLTEPNVSLEDKKKIGVLDTGNIDVTNSNSSITLKNSDYEPINNPYTYQLSGEKVSSNIKPFSSSMLIVQWCRDYLIKQDVGLLSTTVRATSITYEGTNHSIDENAEGAKVVFLDSLVQDGLYTNTGVFTKRFGDEGGFVSLNTWGAWDRSVGDAVVGYGEPGIFFGGACINHSPIVREAEQIFRWNANSFEYDLSRKVYSQCEATGNFLRSKTRYGVGKTKDYPDKIILSKTDLENQYTWYTTPEEAASNGKISAVKMTYTKSDQSLSTWSGAPIKVIGIPGAKDSTGKDNIGLATSFFNDSNHKELYQHPPVGEEYTPSTYDDSGVVIKEHGYYDMFRGDTLFIKPFGISTTTAPKHPVYKTTEEVEWEVKGNTRSNAGTKYGVKLTTTLPKGLEYKHGSSTNSSGVPIDEPAFSKNAVTGETTLVWEFNSLDPSQGDLAEVNFITTPNLKGLTFSANSIAEATVKTVGDMWIQDDPSIKDTSKEEFRASSGKVQLYQMQQIVLTKEVDKDYIEVDTNDAANPAASNDITYKITLENNSTDKLLNVRVVDVMPYNGDILQSNFDGSYTVKKIKVVEGSGDITYTKDPVSDKFRDNPNEIYGWGPYVPDVSSPTIIENAKGFLVSTDELAVGDKLTFEVTISPKNQKAGNIYRNRATFNSNLNLPVSSNIVQTQVLGRDLTGYVWYDDDYNGLINSGEDPVGNIPVKLYRTSYENGSYTKQLVKKSLTGQDFVDGNNDSLIKTGSDGKYKFSNLPEGEYIAEFVIEDIVVTKKIVIVTKKKVGSDDTLNSKADPNTFKTDGYDQPKLNDLPLAPLLGTDKIHHITDVNAGLTRLSKIRLFKYEEGTVIDADGDGKLSDEEIEASTTNALEGAEFQLYKGKSDNPNTIKDENKIGTVKVTGSDGWLEFESLPPGDYTIVETKAPAGFELLKDPIGVTVPTYNYIAIVHVPDKGQTKLPFTGSTKAMRIILIAAAVLMV
ncbi:SpaA isopeptide-forming pilin-related protein, partial [Enterococcus hulanensis]